MTKALLIVDIQNDFMPGGPLGVPGGDQVIPVINALIPHFQMVLASEDWHPIDHTSFAVNHPGKKIGETIEVRGIPQILWPVHCVRYTPGSELVSTLNKGAIEATFQKGTDKWMDSYSAFFDNARLRSTGLEEYLRSRNVHEITIVGLATDYCVLYSVIDALDLGFAVTIVVDACKGINLEPDDVTRALAIMKEKGAYLIYSPEILNKKPFFDN